MSAGAPVLAASVKYVPKKIPVSLASGGMNKLVAILLAIQEQTGGVVFIDEIENGFYFKRLPMIWDAILSFSREYDTQLFISAHSSECLQAAARLAEASSDDFSMVRTVISEGVTNVRMFDGDRFANSVLSDIEVR